MQYGFQVMTLLWNVQENKLMFLSCTVDRCKEDTTYAPWERAQLGRGDNCPHNPPPTQHSLWPGSPWSVLPDELETLGV